MADYKAIIVNNMRKIKAYDRWVDLQEFLPISTINGADVLIRGALNELIVEQVVQIKLDCGVKVYRLFDRIN